MLTGCSVANERDAQGAGIDEFAAAVQTHLAVEWFWFTDLALAVEVVAVGQMARV